MFHASCVEGLRKFGVSKVCPVCRGELEGGPEKNFEEATRRYFFVEAQVKKGQGVWQQLTAAQRQEMKAVLLLWTDAANKGHANAQLNLGLMHKLGRGVKQDN